MNKVYVALYNPMIYESSFGIISVHKTRKGAEMSIEFHKNEIKKEWLKMYPDKDEQKDFPFGEFEAWDIDEYNIEE